MRSTLASCRCSAVPLRACSTRAPAGASWTWAVALSGARLHGVDASPELVIAARARGVDAQVMDGHALAFDSEFDAVFSNAALHLMGNPDRVLEGVRGTFPQLANLEIDSTWGALVDCSPDTVPVISKVDQVEGLVLAAGCSGHGFGMGPGIGYLAAELLRNDNPSVDPTAFRLSRLMDGSPLQIAAI